MSIAPRLGLIAGVALAIGFVPLPVRAQSTGPVDPRLYAGLTWRNLGPFRAGRVAAVSGAIGQNGVFYVGLPAAGVWKTTSAGETWYPIFDSIKEVSSIGAIEVAPSDPNVIYVGTGDIITGGAINEGNGVYKSTDAGKTWRHLGLDATKQIPSMLVDPRDPNLVMIGAQGDVHVKSKSRGVFRSTDGGATWTQTLFVDDTTGLQKLARANDVPAVVFATTVLHYTPPPPPGAPAAGGFGGGGADGPTATMVYKSTDEGVTWHLVERRRTAAAQRAHLDRRRDEHERAARVPHRRTTASTGRTTAAPPGDRWPPTIREFATARAATTAASTSIL